MAGSNLNLEEMDGKDMYRCFRLFHIEESPQIAGGETPFQSISKLFRVCYNLLGKKGRVPTSCLTANLRVMFIVNIIMLFLESYSELYHDQKNSAIYKVVL